MHILGEPECNSGRAQRAGNCQHKRSAQQQHAISRNVGEDPCVLPPGDSQLYSDSQGEQNEPSYPGQSTRHPTSPTANSSAFRIVNSTRSGCPLITVRAPVGGDRDRRPTTRYCRCALHRTGRRYFYLHEAEPRQTRLSPRRES